MAVMPTLNQAYQSRPRRIRIRIGNATEPNEIQQMEQLLSHLKGQPANEALTDTAEAILKKTSRYRSSVCRLGKKDRRDRMTCGLTRSRIIRYIRVEGASALILGNGFSKADFF